MMQVGSYDKVGGKVYESRLCSEVLVLLCSILSCKASLSKSQCAQSPVKNALMGSLIRTLLIQVQKTKVRLIASPECLAPSRQDTTASSAELGCEPRLIRFCYQYTDVRSQWDDAIHRRCRTEGGDWKR